LAAKAQKKNQETGMKKTAPVAKSPNWRATKEEKKSEEQRGRSRFINGGEKAEQGRKSL